MLRAARERQRAALRGMVDDRAALQRLVRLAQRTELLEVLHQFGILVSPRIGAAVERVFKALHAGLVAVVEHRRAGEGVEDQLLHAVAEVFRAAAEQIGHQRRAERVVHQAVRLAAQQVLAALGVGDLRRAVLPDLAEKISVGALLVHRRANFGNELVGELVGDVEPPAGCARAQPVLDNGIITLDDVVNITFFQLVDCGQVLDAPPGVVLVGEGVEVVPAVIGRLLALRRAEVVIKAVGVEIDALSPRVVEDTVEHHVDAALFRLRAERAEVRFIAEQRVNALIAGGVVAVVGRGLEDRAEVVTPRETR